MLGCKNPICKNPGNLVTKAPLTFAWQSHWCHLKHLHSHRWHWQWGHDPSHLSGLWKWAIQSIRGRIAESWKEHKGTDDCRISRKGRISKNMQRSYWIFVYWMPILLYFSHHAEIAAPNGFLHVLQVPDRQTPHVVASGQMSILPTDQPNDQPWSAKRSALQRRTSMEEAPKVPHLKPFGCSVSALGQTWTPQSLDKRKHIGIIWVCLEMGYPISWFITSFFIFHNYVYGFNIFSDTQFHQFPAGFWVSSFGLLSLWQPFANLGATPTSRICPCSWQAIQLSRLHIYITI